MRQRDRIILDDPLADPKVSVYDLAGFRQLMLPEQPLYPWQKEVLAQFERKAYSGTASLSTMRLPVIDPWREVRQPSEEEMETAIIETMRRFYGESDETDGRREDGDRRAQEGGDDLA